MSHYASEELYQVLFEQAADGIFIADAQGHYIEVNRQGCEMLGYSREELLNLSIQHLIPAEDLANQPVRLAELRTGQSLLTERRLRCKDGHLLPVEIRGQMMADGKMLAFVRDITERRRVEAARRESEQKFRSFVEQSSEGFALVEEQGLVIEWNQAQEQMTGLRRAQVIGRPAWEVQQELLPPEVRTLERYERNKQTVGEALHTGQSFIFNKTLEAQVMKPDGERRFFQQTVFPIKTNQGYWIGSVSRDITEQRRANDQLRQLSRAVEQSPVSIVITNTMGAIEYVNPKFTQVTGYTLAEVIGQNPNLLKSGYTSPEEYQRLWDTITSGGQWRGEFQNRKKNGDLYWEAATISPILNERGKITHFLAVKEDITERKRAEAALQASEARLTGIIESAMDAIISVDDEQRIVLFNSAAEQMFGYSAAEVMGQRLDHLLPARFRERHREYIRAFGQAGLTSSAMGNLNNIVGRRANGEEFPLESSISQVEIGGTKLYTVVHRDITERQRAEKALRESEEKYASAFRISPDSININRMSDGLYLDVNEGFTALSGYTREEVIGQSSLTLNLWADPRDRARLLQGLQERGEVTNLETTFRLKDGTLRTGLMSARQIEVGGEACILSITRDISERKQAEEALREMAENMAAAQRIAHFGSWEIDLNDELEFVEPQMWSDECYRIFGVEPGSVEITKELFYSHIHSDDRESALQALIKAIQERTECSYEYRLIRSDGSIRYIHDQVNVVCDEQTGQPVKVVGTTHDVTERKQAEEARVKLEEQLRQAHKMESVGRLAGGIAHDFNNLLTVIRGYCDLMQPRLPGGDPLLKDLEQIRRAAERAATLTRQLLAFSRKQMLAPATLDLNDLVTNLHKMLGRLIGEDVNLVLALQPELWPVKADHGQIEQVIFNLAVNARDAMPTGGMLTIETGNVRLDDSYLEIHLEAPRGPCVMLAVTDTGHGMDAPTQDHIFEPFFTTKEVGQGTGLGLATVYGIIKQSGGDILVYSEPGYGTTFKIYLPASETVPDVPVPQAPRVSHAGTETILLVEDEEGVRNLIGRILKGKGYTVLESRHGDEALLLAGQHQGPIDLLLTDVIMPQMSGRDLAERLKKLQPRLKVLFVSGYTDDAVVRHGLLTAEVEFLSKPFSPDTLAAKVRQVLDK
ncbi:MAG: PAS domain S-box protein [Anaerolineales bacterium]|nr:PAS domain S-box protein [Anaerolineales bacterium]